MSEPVVIHSIPRRVLALGPEDEHVIAFSAGRWQVKKKELCGDALPQNVFDVLARRVAWLGGQAKTSRRLPPCMAFRSKTNFSPALSAIPSRHNSVSTRRLTPISSSPTRRARPTPS